MTKALKNKWKSFKKTLIFFEKKASMEHQNPTLWVVVKRRGINLGSKNFRRKFYSNVYQDGLLFESN
jgi:vancomycin resistance protein YoaR